MQETDDELTEDERIEYEKGIITWEKAKRLSFWFRKEWIWYYFGLLLLLIVVALMAFFHRSVRPSKRPCPGPAREGRADGSQIINWLTPFVKRLQSLKYGWLIPPAILFVLSFPPLFGNGKLFWVLPRSVHLKHGRDCDGTGWRCLGSGKGVCHRESASMD
jgi:hypothetical protein